MAQVDSKVSTMKISEDTKKELVKIGGEYMQKDGQSRSLEAIIKLLIDEHKRKK